MRALTPIIAGLLFLTSCSNSTTLSFQTSDGGVVYADEYGSGSDVVILAHGGRFTKESWVRQAPVIAAEGFRVLAIDFRGRGNSIGPASDSTHSDVRYDVLAAIDYAESTGARSISIVGASFGGWAAGAAIAEIPGRIDKFIVLASGIDEPDQVEVGNTLFILSRDDFRGEGTRRLPDIREDFARIPGRKEMVLLEGDAHAQYLFETDQSDVLMSEILRFLNTSAPTISVFEPGLISQSTLDEVSPSATADGITMVFATTEDWDHKFPFIATRTESSWDKDALHFVESVYNLAIFPDGQTIVFQGEKDTTSDVSRVFVSSVVDDAWSSPVEVEALAGIDAGYFCPMTDSTLYFFGIVGGKEGIYFSEVNGTESYSQATWLSDAVSPVVHGSTTFDILMHPDKDRLIVSRYSEPNAIREAGPPGLYYIVLENGTWLERRILNLPYGWGSTILPDGQFLFTDGEDIWTASVQELGFEW